MTTKSIISLLLLSTVLCFGQKKSSNTAGIKYETKDSFGKLLDSLNVKGSILIYDTQLKTYYSNDFKWAKIGKLPASTFKIPNSIIALETKIIESDTTLIKWNGEKRGLPVWEQDMTFAKALQVSCVPCYQEIARKVGVKRMKSYLAKLGYPGMEVDSANIDYFWLKGKSKISQFEEIDFLYRFYNSELPIAERTTVIVKRMLVRNTAKGYILSGKTGLISGDKMIGWFVGYVVKGDNTYYFATNLEPGEKMDGNAFTDVRIGATNAALRQMGIIE